MGGLTKTNAARLLDRAKIPYGLIPYEVDENNLAAGHVAESLGEDIRQVFKTIVLRGERTGYFVCVIPGNEKWPVTKKRTSYTSRNCCRSPDTYAAAALQSA